MHLPETRFRGISRGVAVAALLALLGLLVLFGAGGSGSPSTTAEAAAAIADGGDLQLYARIVADMRGGLDYYSAAHVALREGGYGTASVFNWRLPLYAVLVAAAPNDLVVQLGLGAVALAAMLLTGLWLSREGAGPLFTGAALLLLAMSLAGLLAPGSALFSEVAAGILILLSIAAFGARLPWLAIAAGAAALFVRELAGPYVLVCLAFALVQRRWWQAGAWIVVLAAFGAYFVLHAMSVEVRLGPDDVAYPGSWLQFGGLPFVLATMSFNGAFGLLPLWTAPFVAVLGLLGLAAWRGGEQALATVTLYALLFLAIGKPFNTYWGALYTPLLTLGLAWSLPALLDLVRAATRSAGR